MAVTPENFLDAPVPGMSLTAEPKSRPWRRPSQASTVDDALALYAPIFKNKKANKQLIQQIENGVPLTSIADLLITANTMEGRHTLDVGILIAPILVETMINLAELAEVDYVVGNEDRETPEERTELVKRAMASVSEVSEDIEPEIQPEEEMPPVQDVEPQALRTGLMARKEIM